MKSGWRLPYPRSCSNTRDAIMHRSEQRQIIVHIRAQWEGIWGRENHRRARKRKAYLISTERHKALFLMQLSALIRSSVEHQLKHIFITQHWCKRILDHLLSHGGVRLQYRTLSSERLWFGTARPLGSLNWAQDGVCNPSGDCDCDWDTHLSQQSPLNTFSHSAFYVSVLIYFHWKALPC